MIRSLIAVAGVLALAVPAASQTAPRGAKAEVVRGVEARAKLSQVINDELFSFAEIGFQEHRSEEHTSELQSLMRISYAVFCLKKKKTTNTTQVDTTHNI